MGLRTSYFVASFVLCTCIVTFFFNLYCLTNPVLPGRLMFLGVKVLVGAKDATYYNHSLLSSRASKA